MLPPSELKNKDFTRVVRGYSIPEVDEYVDFLLQKYSELFKECDRLEKERTAAKTELDAQRREIQTVRNTLIAAQRASETVIADAQKKRAQVMDEARNGCEAVIGQYERQIQQEQEKLCTMKQCVLDFRATLFKEYSDHIQFIEELTKTVPADMNELLATTPKDCTNAVRETVHDMIDDAYVAQTYGDIPEVLTDKTPKTVPVFSNPSAKKIVLPEEDTAPTTEMPSITPQEDSSVGGAKITSIKSSVRALNAQYDEVDIPLDDPVTVPYMAETAAEEGEDEESMFGTEDAFLKFLEAHSNEDDEGDGLDPNEPDFRAVYGDGK